MVGLRYGGVFIFAGRVTSDFVGPYFLVYEKPRPDDTLLRIADPARVALYLGHVQESSAAWGWKGRTRSSVIYAGDYREKMFETDVHQRKDQWTKLWGHWGRPTGTRFLAPPLPPPLDISITWNPISQLRRTKKRASKRTYSDSSPGNNQRRISTFPGRTARPS